MLRNTAQTGSLCYEILHKLEVYATKYCTNWKFMLRNTAQTGCWCYKDCTNWMLVLRNTAQKFMLIAQTGSLCYEILHKLAVYATADAQTGISVFLNLEGRFSRILFCFSRSFSFR